MRNALQDCQIGSKMRFRTAKWGQKCAPGLPNGVKNALQDCQMGSKFENFEKIFFTFPILLIDSTSSLMALT